VNVLCFIQVTTAGKRKKVVVVKTGTEGKVASSKQGPSNALTGLLAILRYTKVQGS
jgi:hypothetical protein